MSTRIYEKTDKGREEIATRKHQMPMRLRSVLVMIDGRQPFSALLSNLVRLGLDKTSIDELVEQEFIRVVPGTEEKIVPEVVHVARLPPAVRRMQKLREANAHLNTLQLMELDHANLDIEIDLAPAPAPMPAAPAVPVISDKDRYHAVHKFYNETIRGNLGLRGFGLQLKVEKAGTLEELRALREPYLDAVKKTRGNEMAQALDARLQSLLSEGSIA
jgi:hypothetical protein